MAVFPSDSVRSKNWGTEILTDADLEGQLDLIHEYLKAALNSSTGHVHDGTSNQAPKLDKNSLVTDFVNDYTTVTGDSADYFLLADASDSNNTKKALVSDIAKSPISCSYKNLSISRSSTTACAVTADEIILNNGSKISSVSFSVAITTSGVGGLDTGTEASGTWYYIYALSASTGIISTSASAPSGQTVYALIGAVRNDGSSNFIDFKQYGSKYYYSTWQTAASGSTATWQSLDTTAYVPSALSQVVRGSIETVANGVGMVTNNSSVSSDYATSAANRFSIVSQYASTIFFEVDIITANTIYWTGDGSHASVFRISGFYITKL